MSKYVHKVYGTPRAIVQDESGWLREATPEEAEAISTQYAKALKQSLVETPQSPSPQQQKGDEHGG